MKNDFLHRFQLTIKRLFDVILCLIVIILGFPLFVLVALLVKLLSPGPLFFIQERVGMNEKTFRLIKFRTMIDTPSKEPVTAWTKFEEGRITRIGRFLRDYGLDELLQVINIIKGEMSIIGPRPPLPAQAKNYTERQRRVFRMRPGVISLPAVRGRRSISMEQRIELHVEYVDNWSLRLDCIIFWKALFVVMRRQNASEPLEI